MLVITDHEYDRLTELIKSNYGINLGQEKRNLLVGRLQNLLVEYNLSSFTEYYHHLISDRTGSAISSFVDKMTTNHTFFMRESQHFNLFRDQVLPHFVKTIPDNDLRLWSAGCSSGEEPYTLAMLIDEYLGANKLFWNTKILATDLSQKVLTSATQGVYTNEQISAMPEKWQKKYFVQDGQGIAEISPKIKQEVIFRRLNLMEEFPLKKKFHVIFCRNVMIYFDRETKIKLVEKFYNQLEPGGYLFVGLSETIDRTESKLKSVAPSVFRKV